jgi:predicted nucleic acid-binding Zn finger protein
VRLRAEGDRCTCPWFSKHQGQRGPCKHVLAARIFVEGDDDRDDQESGV